MGILQTLLQDPEEKVEREDCHNDLDDSDP